MNNLDKIIGKINAQAQSEADAVFAAGAAKAAQIMEEGEHRASDTVTRAEKKAQRDSLAVVERAYSTADMKKREIILGTKVGLIGKAFSDAERKLLELDDKAYCAFVGHLLCDAVSERVETVEKLRREYGDEEEYSLDFEALFNEKDKRERAAGIIKTAKAYLKKLSPEMGNTEIRVCEETANIAGGLILRYGDIETNCSVEAVIAGARETLEPKVASILFAKKTETEE